jgi:hypothetical protein
MNQLIHCINCNEIFLKTPFDQWPEYEFYSNHSPESFRSIERDDFQDFLKNHRGHRLENLKILEDSFISEKSFFEPIKVSYFKATNGKDKFVIKKFRENIGEPLKYKLIYGDFFLSCIDIQIQSEEIKKQLKSEIMPPSLLEEKIDAFIKLYQRIAKAVDIKNLERTPEDSPNPLEIYYKMDDVSLVYLLRNCRKIFKGQEYLDIEEFVHRHRDDGVLLLKAIHKIKLVETAKSKKVTPARIPLERKMTIEKK